MKLGSECTCVPGADLTYGCPVHPDEHMLENARRLAGLNRVCGDVQAGTFLVLCECGSLRQHDRPHAFVDAADAD